MEQKQTQQETTPEKTVEAIQLLFVDKVVVILFCWRRFVCFEGFRRDSACTVH